MIQVEHLLNNNNNIYFSIVSGNSFNELNTRSGYARDQYRYVFSKTDGRINQNNKTVY